MRSIHKFIFLLAMVQLVVACKSTLNIEPASEMSPSLVLTKKGATALLYATYADANFMGDRGANRIYAEESTTDVLINFRGLLNGDLQPFQTWTWIPTGSFFAQFYNNNYQAIRDANILLASLPENTELTENEKSTMAAEARFLRALSYQLLYGWYGPVPLVTKPFTSSTDDFQIPKATEADMTGFIEQELLESAAALPSVAPGPTNTGKATKGAAFGMLTKFYMMLKDWPKAAAMAKQVMDLGVYGIQADYAALFAISNKGNSEMIFVYPAVNKNLAGNVWVANALPPLYPTNVFNTATQVCVPVSFYNTFTANDKRKDLIVTSYTNKNNQVVNLRTGVDINHPRSLKYPIDPVALDRFHGDDIPLLRYADIKLCRAEALVQSTGAVPQEALDLLNEIRVRAGLTALLMTDVPDKTTFITTLLRERAWEFYSEGKRREDLLRNDLFLKNASDRGFSARALEFRKRFPFPQAEVDANKNLVQNPGY